MRGGWKRYAAWFLFGGTLSLVVGSVADHYGPAVAGVVLSLASMGCLLAALASTRAGATRHGLVLDALGGAIGLLAFAATVAVCASWAPAWLVLTGATLVWGAVVLPLAWVVHRPGDSPARGQGRD